jgi:hypothetical protein
MSLDGIINLAGIVVPVASLAASVVNQQIRSAQAESKPVASWLLTLAAGLNAVALNGDKAVQAVKLAKGGKAS